MPSDDVVARASRSTPPPPSSKRGFESLADLLSDEVPSTKRLDPLARGPMRRRTGSITITEPVGFLAPLLAPTFVEELSPADPTSHPFVEARPSPYPSLSDDTGRLSTGPVTVAQTQSVAITLDGPGDRSEGRLRTLALRLACGGAGVLVILMLVLFGCGSARALRDRSAKGAASAPSFTASVAAASPAPSVVVVAPVAPVAPVVEAAPVSAGARVDVDPPADTKPNPKLAPPSQTRMILPPSSKGHRIFVDGRVVGSGPEPLTVKCGRHTVKIGSAGKPRVKDLPCGEEITLPAS